MEKHDLLISAALRCGAAKAAVIPREQFVLNADFRAMCASNQCGMYGQCWQCPPDIGDVETLMQKVMEYPYGMLYQTISSIEDSFDIEGMSAASRAHAKLSRKLQNELADMFSGDVLHLSSGGCKMCDTCAKRENLPCRQPELAMSSMEGYGFDVYNTTKHTDLKYINGQNTVTYFGIVLFSE